FDRASSLDREHRERFEEGTRVVPRRPAFVPSEGGFRVLWRRTMAGDDLKKLADRAVAEIAVVKDVDALEAARLRYLGRQDGPLSEATKRIAKLPAKEKP